MEWGPRPWGGDHRSMGVSLAGGGPLRLSGADPVGSLPRLTRQLLSPV